MTDAIENERLLSDSNVPSDLKAVFKDLCDFIENSDKNEQMESLNGSLMFVAQFVNNGDNASARNTCRDGTLPLALIKIIRKTGDANLCSLSLDVLSKLLNKHQTTADTDMALMIKLLTTPNNYQQLFETLELTHVNHSSKKDLEREIELKILKILDCLHTKRPRHQFSNVTCDSIKYIKNLMSKVKDDKERAEILLNLLKSICRTKKFCQTLATPVFFDDLYDMTESTRQGETVTKIIRAMSKCPEALNEMRHSQKILPLILILVNTYPITPLAKKSLITTLYRISRKAPEKIANSGALWNSLLETFKSYGNVEEQRFRMTIIKLYTLLNVSAKRNVISSTCLNFQPNFPQKVRQNLKYSFSEDSENENDYTDEDEDEDEDDKLCENNNFDDVSDDEISVYSNASSEDLTFSYNNNEITNFNSVRCFFKEFVNSYDDNTESGSYNRVAEKNVIRNTHNKKIAYPDAVLAEADDVDNDSCIDTRGRLNFVHLMKKVKTAKGYENNCYPSKIVFDLDELLEDDRHCAPDIPTPGNSGVDFNKCIFVDLERDRVNASPPTLKFESRFESGNLRCAKQIDDYEYDLLLSPDICTCRCHQWFYFQITNMVSDKVYTFNIINFDKINSQFNYGMQPVLFSVRDHILNGTGWKRAGKKIVYYGNNYTNEDYTKQYRTLTFSLSFDYDGDFCYLAYHYPYTYTRLLTQLRYFSLKRNNVYCRVDNLCNTISGNYVPLVTITAADGKDSFGIPLDKRPIVFFTGRVHPGESNSSWILDGIMKFLLNESDEKAKAAREMYVFKIIPMLNPEGVIFGNTRNGLTGCDLNRCWSHPNKHLQPEIFYTKKLVEFVRKELKHPITAFIDVHGHSRKKHFFFYGCNPQQSWNKKDKLRTEYDNYQIIPDEVLINEHMKASFCQYKIEKNKETTCRVVMWREFSIKGSYTLECSYCSGENKKKITTKILQDIGKTVVIALANLASKVLLQKTKMADFGFDYTFLENVPQNEIEYYLRNFKNRDVPTKKMTEADVSKISRSYT